MPSASAASERQLCILVLGMHRSGTSAVTRVLSLMGAALPTDVLGANFGNAAGHWEPEPLVLLNDRLLMSVDRSWFDWRRPERPIAPELEGELSREIAAQYGDRSPFVLKDPRTCLLIPSYHAALATLGAAVAHVIVLRNPMASSSSLSARDSFISLQHAQFLWLRYLLEAERNTRGQPRCFVRYDRLLRNWRAAMQVVEPVTGLAVPVADSDAAGEIDRFIDRGLRHHQADVIAVEGAVGDWLTRTNAALGQLAADPEDHRSAAELDEIYQTFEAATQALAVPQPVVPS